MRRFLSCFLAIGIAGCQKDGPGDTSPNDTTPGPQECSAYEFNGATYDCGELDPCDTTDISFRTACCSCDPVFCELGTECTTEDTDSAPTEPAETCMACHNGSDNNDYGGDGLTNPHPFSGAAYVKCTTCHGGDGDGAGKDGSHVPPPPQVGDRLFQQNNPEAYFNRLTLTGLDKYPDYEVDGVTYTALDYLQFVNPGDLRVVNDGRSCGTGGCHKSEHVEWLKGSPIATEVGFYSATMEGVGVNNAVPAQANWYQKNAADYAFRAVSDPSFSYDPNIVGPVAELKEFPEHAVYGDPAGIYQNFAYLSAQLPNYLYTAAEDPSRTNQIKSGTPLEDLIHQTVSFACGDCHLGSAGQNNRYADFRSSGCTACHMEYSFDGRSKSTDPNVNKLEPANPDAIAAPERPHIMDHQIRNVAKTLPNGTFIRGISDKVCVGCHQGSNRTVLQFWGVRLDQNQDLNNGFQYPAAPVNFADATGDTRLYDPSVNNQTFNGRIAGQHIVFEDYDGDNRDDTPEDVHYEAGMGCIDCHGTRDLHNGADSDPTSGRIVSRQEQTIGIRCESCHGGIDAKAEYATCENYEGDTASCAVDAFGNPLRNVTRDASGDFWLRSRVTGSLHYVPQTIDTIVQSNNEVHPVTGQLVYNAFASYAMGRADGSALTGTGPIQTNPNLYDNGFAHSDSVGCATCHASWTNSCVGCHLALEYDANPQNFSFSNTTGERIVTNVTNADFVYQTPVLFTMGVDSHGQIASVPPGMKMFFRYTDLQGTTSQVFAFTDRNGNGNNPFTAGRGAFPNLNHEQLAPHSIRGKVTQTKEGPRYCVACHLTQDAVDNFGAEYDVFRNAMENRDYAQLDFNLLQTHIGSNTGNQLNSPFFVYQAAGLGTGLFLFDENGCPVNPLDNNPNRFFCNGAAPAANFNLNNVVYDLDKVVEIDGTSNAANSHPMLDGASPLRGGALDPNLAGPLGAQLLQKLTDPNFGVVLDSWLDANGAAQGDAANYLQ